MGMWRTAGRLLLIPLAVVIAAAAALLVLVTLGLEHLTHWYAGKEPDLDLLRAITEIVAKGASLAAGVMLLPAFAVVLIGEVARIRSWLYYMIGGGVSLALLPLASGLVALEPAALPPPIVWQVLATAGFAGGLVYWLIAGRTA